SPSSVSLCGVSSVCCFFSTVPPHSLTVVASWSSCHAEGGMEGHSTPASAGQHSTHCTDRCTGIQMPTAPPTHIKELHTHTHTLNNDTHTHTLNNDTHTHTHIHTHTHTYTHTHTHTHTTQENKTEEPHTQH